MTVKWAAARDWVVANHLVTRLSTTAVAVIQVAILFQAISRGWDYIVIPTDKPTPMSLLVVEQILPLDVSGWLFVAAGTVAFVGIFYSPLPLASLGHAALSVIFAVFAVGALTEIALRDGPDPSGWRTGTSWVTAAVLHATYAVACETSWRVARAERAGQL